MEQLTQLATDFGLAWPKFIAQIILFLIVWALLAKFAFGPIIAILEERRRRIEEAHLNSEKIKKQLAESEAHYQEILLKANTEAEKLIEEARKSGEAITQKQAQDAIRQAEDIISKARASIEIERNRMVGEVRKEMVNLVVSTTEKVTGKVLTADDQTRLNEETTRQLAA